MKQNYFTKFPGVRRNKILSALLFAGGLFGTNTLDAQASYTFISAGASGQLGPSQGQVNTAYAATNLAGAVTVLGNGLQQWTVPTTGLYRIRAIGAAGGSVSTNCSALGGLGADISGDYNLTAGQVLLVLVGQQGISNSSDAGGGGGSYVTSSASVAMVVAGGGGGASNNIANCGSNLAGVNGDTTTAGTAGAAGGGTGGTNGNGGVLANGGGGGAGGGFSTDGSGGGNFGKAFMNGGAGGTGSNNDHGGYGGGGTGWYTGGNGGGGGGYSGGGTQGSQPYAGGGGGGSYNSGANQTNTVALARGNGTVIISSLCDVQVNGNTTICAGGSTSLTSTAVNNISWSTGSNAATIFISPLGTTVYTVTGNGTINNCMATIIVTVVVNQLPTLTVSVSPALLCAGSIATVSASGASTYTWSTGPVSPTAGVSPVVTTTYSVIATSSVGCVNTEVISVPVNTLELSISGSSAVCLGNAASLTGSGGTSLNWLGFGPFANINPSPTVATTYTLSGIDPNNCLITSTVTVLVNQNPTVTASASKTLSCKNQPVLLTAGGADSYQWGASANAATTTTVSVVPTINTTYNYSVTGTVGTCTSTANVSVQVELCTGLNELSAVSLAIDVYPNPNNGQFMIKTSGDLKLVIVNNLGQAVKTLDVQGNDEVSISGLAKGIYFIVGDSNGNKINKKILVD